MLLIFLLSIPHLNSAQETVVTGVVTDQEGKPLKNAKITFLDPSRGHKFNLKSNKKGNFIKVGIPPSFYRIIVELEGYFTLESQFRIRLGMTKKMIIKLKKIPPRIDEGKDLAEAIDFFMQGKYEEAIESFKKVVEKFPSNVEGFYNLGLSYLRKGDIDQAIVSFEKVTELKPEGFEAYLALGECYFNKGESEKAMENFSRTIELQPDNPMAYYNLGIVYYRLDKTEEALDAFNKSIELNPEFSSSYYQAALASIKKGDFKKAIIYFEIFLRVDPDATEATQVKAMIEKLKKRLDKTENK